MYKFTVLAATFAAFASAYTTPTTQCTDACNPIAKPGLNEVVPVGAPYTISWGPTTTGTVTILLEQGPSTNIVPLYALAEKIANTGTFTWTPSADLVPTGNSGYGLQIISDADGTFQWSTQFGIGNAGYVAGSSSSAAASASASVSSSVIVDSSSAFAASSSGVAYVNGTVSSTAAATTGASATGSGYSNGTAVITSTGLATGAATTLATTTGTTSATSSSTSASASNGAVAMGASIGGAFVAFAAAAFAL